jgi:hypothetical protein
MAHLGRHRMRKGPSKPISKREFGTFVLAVVGPLLPVWLIPGIDDAFRAFLSVVAPVGGGLLCARWHRRWPQLPRPLAWFFLVMIAGMTAPFFLPEHWRPIPVMLMFAVLITLIIRFLSRQLQAEDEALRAWRRLPATLRASRVLAHATRATSSGHPGVGERWYLELDFGFEHQGAIHHVSTAQVPLPTPRYDSRAEAEAALVALQASPLVVCMDPDDPSKVWPERWLHQASLRTGLTAMKKTTFAVVGSTFLAFFLVMGPLVMASGTAASILPAEASVKGVSTLLMFATMLTGFVFTVVTAGTSLRRAESPSFRSTAPRKIGALLVLLAVSQLLLVGVFLRRTGDFDEKAAERYGVRALAAWIAGTLPR